MEDLAVLTLAGLCLGIALSGLLTVILKQGPGRERICLLAVYLAFVGMIAFPLVKTFAGFALLHYMPMLLVMLIILPPAFYHYVAAKTLSGSPAPFSWRDAAMPIAGALICIGFWILPLPTKEAMFISGELPQGFVPAALALSTFVILTTWLVTSFAYLVAILRRLTAYRTHIRNLYSDADERDMRWVDVVMAVLVLIWAAGAFSLANENYADGALFIEELFLALIAGGLLVLNIFAPLTISQRNPQNEEPEPDLKYARSALTRDRAEQLAKKLKAAMQNDTLYLDPSLSLQKLSKHVGALPNQVSQTLNQEIGTSFFDYVSGWRVEASKPLITAGDASVLAVALEVGFNSRSAFYNAFKRETGMTPKDFRAGQQNAH